ncbi:MAG TPA: DUF488 domain-containing protein [Gemmatimonadales bacterium]|nr:DUF488 domain-containing protein [Gemmatimonadales bacterium]
MTEKVPAGTSDLAVNPRIWTIGHSTRSQTEFLDLLAEHNIQAVADVRRHPGSRRLPHFESAALARTLASRAVEYLWLPDLGGRRRPHPESVNTGWRNLSFRGYADYLHSEPFAESLAALLNLCWALRTAVMCAEAVWWRCHRGLIADVLRWQGFEVIHILGPGSSAPHPYSPAARMVRGRLSYASVAPTGRSHPISEEQHEPI